MCYAILEVKFINKAEATERVDTKDEADMVNRIEQLQKRELVESIRIFRSDVKLTRSVVWSKSG